MNCVFYENKAPNGFEEDFVYSKEMPYTVYIKNFSKDDIVPIHYAKTIEILVCRDLKGEIVIGGHSFTLGGNQVFIIPPYTLHSNIIRMCEGVQYVFKISFPDIEHYINIPNFLNLCGYKLDQLPYSCCDYESINDLITGIIENDTEMSVCILYILKLFYTLSKHVENKNSSENIVSRNLTRTLQSIVKWTQKNYMNKITVEDAAKNVGYSKTYFCSFFKFSTGLTYYNYLNSVRIYNACILLEAGYSVNEVASKCGFESSSYFIQVFKKSQHITPLQYIKSKNNGSK